MNTLAFVNFFALFTGFDFKWSGHIIDAYTNIIAISTHKISYYFTFEANNLHNYIMALRFAKLMLTMLPQIHTYYGYMHSIAY